MKKILIVNANYYKDVTDKLVKSSKNILKKRGLSVSVLMVPGIFEIPIAIRKNINKYEAFLAIGCVIKGKHLI